MIQTNDVCSVASPAPYVTKIAILQGRSMHKILLHLAAGPRSYPSIIRLLGLPSDMSRTQSKRLKSKVGILLGQQLICKSGRDFRITEAGAAELRRLGPIHSAGTPSVRIFARTEAA